MSQGTVLTSLFIRAQPSTTTGAKIGGLSAGDIVTGTVDANNWIKLETWKRNGVSMTLPAPDCYASCGASQEFIRLETAPPPPNGDATIQVTHEIMVDGVAYVPVSGNPIPFVKK